MRCPWNKVDVVSVEALKVIFNSVFVSLNALDTIPTTIYDHFPASARLTTSGPLDTILLFWPTDTAWSCNLISGLCFTFKGT